VDLHPGEIMKLCRNRKKMSQEKLAMIINDSNPGQLTYQMQLSRIESGFEEPDAQLKTAIEIALGHEIWKLNRKEA
jgi:transcriptional regulator with XRE-family HTH domain